MAYTAFFYGTLMAPEVLSRVCYGYKNHENISRLTIKPAILTGYRRRRVLGCDYPAVTPSTESTVRGAYVTGLTATDIIRLDVFEGDQYKRGKVKVQVWDNSGLDENIDEAVPGETKETETYIWATDVEELEDKEWDFDHFRKEKMKRWMGESADEDMEDVDEGFADADAVDDPTGGRGSNGHITSQLNAHHQQSA